VPIPVVSWHWPNDEITIQHRLWSFECSILANRLPGHMSNAMKIKTCGREPSCDLVLEHPTVSRIHATIQLADNGLVSLEDNSSRNGMFLNRNDNWIRAKKVTLCIGDRIRLGEIEVPLEQLTTVFGGRSPARLEARHFPLKQVNNGTTPLAPGQDRAPSLQKPRRNPITGKIEENRTV
jgi:pSer/pThr/pTyr-binding forkhead associated (FHA) protein